MKFLCLSLISLAIRSFSLGDNEEEEKEEDLRLTVEEKQAVARSYIKKGKKVKRLGKKAGKAIKKFRQSAEYHQLKPLAIQLATKGISSAIAKRRARGNRNPQYPQYPQYAQYR